MFTLLAIVVSGGNNELVYMEDHQRFQSSEKRATTPSGNATTKWPAFWLAQSGWASD
jgi:tRNA A37 threonylcarbamoyltransferase TsaD